MPLKLSDIQHPSSTNIINTWADEKEITLNQHQLDINKLLNQFSSLLKNNPTLKPPNGK